MFGTIYRDPFDKIIARLQELKENYLAEFPLQEGEEIFVYYSCSYDEGSFEVFLKRWETDIEYDKRIKKENKVKASVKDRELKEYERLRKKYGTKKLKNESNIQ